MIFLIWYLWWRSGLVTDVHNVEQTVWTNQGRDFWLDQTGNGIDKEMGWQHEVREGVSEWFRTHPGPKLIRIWVITCLDLTQLVPGWETPRLSVVKINSTTYLSSAVPSNFSNGLYWFLLVSSGLSWPGLIRSTESDWLTGPVLVWPGSGFWFRSSLMSCVSGWVLIGWISAEWGASVGLL